jgi:hypothetical protein
MVFEKIWEYIKKFFSNKKRNIVLIIVAALLLIDIILGIICRVFISKLPDQLAANRWDYDGKVAQVSLFFTEDRSVTPDDIKRLEYNLKKKLGDAGVIAVEDGDSSLKSGKEIVDTVDLGTGKGNNSGSDIASASEEIKVYNSCYSAQGISTIVFENRKAENVSTIGADGDFFFFHPLELVNGSYFMADDVMKDKIVIDEDLAWQLFGSDDIIGQCVTIGGINHYVSGVVRRQEGRFNEAAGLSESIVYMSYDSLSKYGEILSGKTTDKEISEDGVNAKIGGINCYEIVCPNPVDGLLAKITKESADFDDKYVNVIDNTDRFSFLNLLGVSVNFGIRSMWDKPIFYPYWENVARGYEDVLALLNMIRLICEVACVIMVCSLIIFAYRNKKWTIEGLLTYAADKKYEIEARHKERLADNKQAGESGEEIMK